MAAMVMGVEIVMLVLAVGTLLAAIGAWLHARPTEPFEVTQANNGVFGLRRLGYWPAVVEHVTVPHHTRLIIANESAITGPFRLKRQEAVFLSLQGAQAPCDIVVVWRPRGRRHKRGWYTFVL